LQVPANEESEIMQSLIAQFETIVGLQSLTAEKLVSQNSSNPMQRNKFR